MGSSERIMEIDVRGPNDAVQILSRRLENRSVLSVARETRNAWGLLRRIDIAPALRGSEKNERGEAESRIKGDLPNGYFHMELSRLIRGAGRKQSHAFNGFTTGNTTANGNRETAGR